MSFQFLLLTPEGKIFEDAVDSIAAPGLEGGFEIFSGHTAMLSALKGGQARIRQKKKEIAFNITSGILEVTGEHNVLLLADQAQPAP